MFYIQLEKACKNNNTSVNAVLKKIGRGSSAMANNWKNGGYPKIDIVKQLAIELNVSTDYLIFGTEHNNEDKEIIDKYHQLNEYGKTIIKGEIYKQLQLQNQPQEQERDSKKLG